VRVVWSPLADRQVDDAVEYIAHDDPIAAIRHEARAFDEREALIVVVDPEAVRLVDVGDMGMAGSVVHR